MFEAVLERPHFLYGAAALAGIMAAVLLLRRSCNPKTWVVVDLVWILGGGLSLVATTVSTVQLSHLIEIRRRSDLFATELAAARNHSLTFAAATCDPRGEPLLVPAELDALCRPVRTFLSDSAPDGLIAAALASFGTETLDAAGPLYVEPMIANLMAEEAVPPHSTLRPSGTMVMSMAVLETVKKEIAFSPRPGLDAIERAEQALPRTGVAPAAVLEGEQILLGYDIVEADFERLKADWLALSRLNVLLLSRILAVSFIALVFPLRVGKSWADLYPKRA